ncbi:MAG: aldo/keto reductase [bacterium]|nr:aldo/keto reductase [bacterium]
MRTRALGKTGMRVTELCMGCWEIGGLFWGPIDQVEARKLLWAAFDAGVTTYDLADVYGNGRSECLVGRAFHDRRDKVVLISKAGYLPGADGAQSLYQPQVQCHEPKYLRQACEMSLWRLETDYIDVFLLHDPPMEVVKRQGVWNVLRKLKAEGKIRAFGASAPLNVAVEAARNGAEVIETPFSLLLPQAGGDLFPLAKKEGVGVLARSPFTSGRLFQTGKDAPTKPFRFLAQKDRPLTAAAIKYVLSQTAVSSVVTGMMKRTELKKNVVASTRPFLTRNELAKIVSLQG